jgi:hypothetical protein
MTLEIHNFLPLLKLILKISEERQQEQTHYESLTLPKESPISSQILLTLDSKVQDSVLELATNEKLMWADLPTSQGIFETNRLKRQIIEDTDCSSRHDECKIILDSKNRN